MALEGAFTDFHIADIVQLIGLQRKTGTLTLDGDEDTLSVTFQDGAVAWAQSARVPWEQRMAQLLVPQGLLTPAQLGEALALSRETRKSLNDVLAEKGILRKEDWDRVLALEVEESVYRPFRWTAGRYRFVSQPSVDLAGGKVGPLATEAVLLEGIRRLDEWPMIRQKIPSSAMVFKVSSRPGPVSPKRVLPNEVKMLDLVDGTRTVRELADASGLGEFEALRSLASLARAGAITPVDGAPGAPAPRLLAPPTLGPPAWLPKVAWGAASAWLIVCLVFFGWEPSGLVPLSRSRTGALDRVRSIRARTDLAQLARDLEWYSATMGEHPASLEAVRTQGRPFQDPWGHPYQVRRTGTADGAGPGAGVGVRVASAGPDGRIGTPDDIAVSDR
ncbi:MAG: DUF4388 domain-containing protein [candidate division NC10 bacterium]|nr:DUF4388 domain-containing protein [candidate division NC10 bacterium]